MRLLYTLHEGDTFKPLEIYSPEGKPIFAIVLPDGTIYDETLKEVDKTSKLTKEEFKRLFFFRPDLNSVV